MSSGSSVSPRARKHHPLTNVESYLHGIEKLASTLINGMTDTLTLREHLAMFFSIPIHSHADSSMDQKSLNCKKDVPRLNSLWLMYLIELTTTTRNMELIR